jgi:hypothetical protein
MSGLQIVKATAITSAMMTGTDVAEADHAEWTISTTYAVCQRVIVAADHKVYESLQAANLGKTPSTQCSGGLRLAQPIVGKRLT